MKHLRKLHYHDSLIIISISIGFWWSWFIKPILQKIPDAISKGVCNNSTDNKLTDNTRRYNFTILYNQVWYKIYEWFEKEFEDTEGVIRIRKSKDTTMAKRKRTSNGLQNITQKYYDQVTRTRLKIRVPND